MLGNLNKLLKKPWATVTSLVTCLIVNMSMLMWRHQKIIRRLLVRKMTLEVRNIYPLTPTFKKVASLYEAAFPVEERLPLWQLSWNSLKNGQSFLAYFDQEVFIGFTYASVLIIWSTYSFLRLRKVNSRRVTVAKF